MVRPETSSASSNLKPRPSGRPGLFFLDDLKAQITQGGECHLSHYYRRRFRYRQRN
jgi:hypothetical protein